MASCAPLVIKYGGAVMDDAALAEAFAHDVARLVARGLRPVVVHGGGPALTRMLERLGTATEFVDGHRVTDRDGAEVAEMVLSGRLNKEVVSRFTRAGLRAVGLSGTDGALLRVRRHRPRGQDIGFVGEVEEVDATALLVLLEGGFVPVLSSTARDAAGDAYNVNADVVAGAVAAALGASRLVFLSDVPGVLRAGARVPLLTLAEVRTMLASEEATGGMRPKLEAAEAALAAGVPDVHVLDGREPHGVLDLLERGRESGTRLVVESPGDGVAPIAAPAPAVAGALAARGAACLMNTYGRYPIEVAAARGVRVEDASGRSFLDFVAGIAVTALGHGHPAVVAAIRRAASGPLHVSNLYWSEPMVRLAERLTTAARMERAFFCNSGAEAIEAAIKLARKARPGRPKLVVFERSFHGRTLGALSCTIQSAYQEPFRPLLAGVAALPFGDFDAAAAAIDRDTAAVLIEPIQGEGGVRPVPAGFLAHLRKACDSAGALLVLDEVQTGLGRTGSLFAFEEEGVLPDAVAVAKALGAGLPIGALLARGEAAEVFSPGDHGSTFGGGLLVAEVANAVLDVILAKGFLDGVRAAGDRLGTALAALTAKHDGVVVEARGKGLMRGLLLREPVAATLVARLHDLGLLTVPAGKDVLRLLPPLVVTAEEIDEATALLDRGLGSLVTEEAPIAGTAR